MKFIMLINVKMPTIVGILTFVCMINRPSESLKAIKVFIFQQFSFYEQLKFHAQLTSLLVCSPMLQSFHYGMQQDIFQ